MQHYHVFFFSFFFKWGIVWKVLAGWVRCDGIPQHSGILRVCAFVCALVIISPFSCFFDVWIKMILSLHRPAAASPYFHIRTIILWLPPEALRAIVLPLTVVCYLLVLLSFVQSYCQKQHYRASFVTAALLTALFIVALKCMATTAKSTKLQWNVHLCLPSVFRLPF